MSIEYYNQNANAFFENTIGADAAQVRARFLAHVPDGGHVLDAGCGSGRDSAAFRDLGYAVTAFDGSRELARLASDYLGQPVLALRFEEIGWHAAFDGIWASASLLHVSEGALPAVLGRLGEALKPGATLFASFKYGDQERLTQDRLFTDMNETRIVQLMQAARLDLVEIWTTQDVRPERSSERWLNVIGRRPG